MAASVLSLCASAPTVPDHRAGDFRRDRAVTASRSLVLFAATSGDHLRRDQQLKKSASAAMAAFHRLHGAVADAQPAPAGERWDHEGTAPGEDQDAEIIRRIRERCPDGRFDCSDAELIELFKRNRTVLGRTDDDVIAAMTRPR